MVNEARRARAVERAGWQHGAAGGEHSVGGLGAKSVNTRANGSVTNSSQTPGHPPLDRDAAPSMIPRAPFCCVAMHDRTAQEHGFTLLELLVISSSLAC